MTVRPGRATSLRGPDCRSASPAGQRIEPLRHLGRFRLVAIGINSVIGGGIFILPAEVAGLIGPTSILAYVVPGVVAIGVGLALASLASRYETPGGPYLYVPGASGGSPGLPPGGLFSPTVLPRGRGLATR